MLHVRSSMLLRRASVLSAPPVPRVHAARLSAWRGSVSVGEAARSFAASGSRHGAIGARMVLHDRALCTTLGVVSGGVAVTALVRPAASSKREDGTVALKATPATGSALLDRIVNWYRDYEQGDFFWGWTRDIRRQLQDDNVKALASIIAANTLVLGLWRVSPRFPALNQWMWRNFACSYNAVTHGRRVHTLLTSAFSHITLPHFAINMFMLWEFGRQVLAPSTSVNNQQDRWYSRAVANSRVAGYFSNPFGETAQLLSLEKFLALYFGSAFASSALSVVVSRLRGSPGVFTIGASGAVMGIFTVYCLTFPQRELMLYGIINLTAAEMLQLTTAFNLVGSAFQRSLRVDCVGHLGGQSTGYIAHEATKRRNY